MASLGNCDLLGIVQNTLWGDVCVKAGGVPDFTNLLGGEGGQILPNANYQKT